MNKGILLVGPAYSGKTHQAKEIAKDYAPENVVWVYGRTGGYIHPFGFSDCEKSTELIIIEDIRMSNDNDYQFLCELVENGVLVEKRGNDSFRIHPKIVVSYNVIHVKIIGYLLNEFCDSLSKHFEVIECNYKSPFEIWADSFFIEGKLDELVPIRDAYASFFNSCDVPVSARMFMQKLGYWCTRNRYTLKPWDSRIDEFIIQKHEGRSEQFLFIKTSE